MTNLFDAEQFPALELVGEHHERWEEAIVFDDQKTQQDPCRAEKTTNMRSEASDGLRQELYALSLGHYSTRLMMLEATDTSHEDIMKRGPIRLRGEVVRGLPPPRGCSAPRR